MTSPRYTFSSWWSPNQETSRQDLLSLTSLGISFPEKYISHKSDEQYFLKQYFCIWSTCTWKKRSKFQTFSAHSISTTIWPPGGTTCISWKFSHQVTPLAIVGKLATRWLHFNKLKIWPPCGATCISWKFGDQVVPLVLVINLATRWHHLY